VPCGISDRGVTSLQTIVGGPLAIPDVEAELIRQFAAVFDRTVASEESQLSAAYR
jgi:lipoate-protein ligase B